MVSHANILFLADVSDLLLPSAADPAWRSEDVYLSGEVNTQDSLTV